VLSAVRRWLGRRPSSPDTAAAQLAAIVASADDAIVSKTLDGVITSWNRAAERMFGYTADEAVGRPITLIIPPERLDEEMEILRRLRRGEAIRHFETERRAKDGRLIPISLVISPMTDARGRLIGASKIARDISELRAARLEAEERRRIAEELARLARVMTASLDVTTVGEGIVAAALALFEPRAAALRLVAPGGSLVGVAFAGAMQEAFAVGHAIPPGAASVSGLAIAERQAVWTDDAFADPRLVMADDIRRGMQAAGDAAVLAVPLSNGRDVFGALSIADRRGRVFTSADAATLQAFADQAALAIVNARLYEEAARRQREAEVVAETARRINASLDLQTTLEHLVEGARELCDADIARIVVREPESGRMVLRHHVGTRWAGYRDGITVEPGQGTGGVVLLTGKPFRTEDYGTDERITPHFRAMALADGTVTQVVVPIPAETGIGGLIYVDRRVRRPFDDADEALLLRLADHAATAIQNSQRFAAERAARAEADAANRGKDQFLAVLSHELRTPLNAILGWVRLLRGGHLDESQRAHAVGVIERNAHQQAQLVADLLDISRIAAGKMEIDRVPVDLVLVVQEAIEAMSASVDAKRVTLETRLDDVGLEVLGEPRRLQQVVSNLLANAIKFTPEGGRVTLRLVRHETNARLVVSDTGEGIHPSLLARIFEPFEQGDASTTRIHQGLGLGLAIVRQMVGLHGGTIRAESAGKGTGATFTVDLPVLAVRVAPSDGAGGDAAAPGVAGLRVLIVDDQRDSRELLALVLANHGAEPRTAASAHEALATIAAHDIDALVSDISMPEVDGFELVGRMRDAAGDRGRLIRAIAVTAYTGHEVRARALGAGFDAHATKPVDPDELIGILASLRGRAARA